MNELQYPDGQLGDADDGMLHIASYIENDRLILDFGKKVTWMGFDKAYLRTFIDKLEEEYKKL